MHYVHGFHTTRATSDINIGVFVSDWERSRALKEAFVGMGKFKPARQVYRLLYGDEWLLDIVPFGRVSENNDSISWPPEHAVEKGGMERRGKDAHDLFTIIKHYIEADVLEREAASPVILRKTP